MITNKATVKALILSDFPNYYKKTEFIRKQILSDYHAEGMFKFMKESEGK